MAQPATTRKPQLQISVRSSTPKQIHMLLPQGPEARDSPALCTRRRQSSPPFARHAFFFTNTKERMGVTKFQVVDMFCTKLVKASVSPGPWQWQRQSMFQDSEPVQVYPSKRRTSFLLLVEVKFFIYIANKKGRVISKILLPAMLI
jgi:hypothetical protein